MDYLEKIFQEKIQIGNGLTRGKFGVDWIAPVENGHAVIFFTTKKGLKVKCNICGGNTAKIRECEIEVAAITSRAKEKQRLKTWITFLKQ